MSLALDLRKQASEFNTRDLTQLVHQVTAILPQFSEDAACEALVQCDEDVERAIELLLSRPMVPKKTAKPEKQAKSASANSGGSSQDAASTKRKDVSAKLDGLIQQVLTILPQSGEDGIHAALSKSREDIGKAVDFLLTDLFKANMSVKVRNGDSDGEGLFDISEREARPKTTGEKEIQKHSKKVREIERIEERIKNGEKVDPLQLPKLEKKGECQAQLAKAEDAAKAEISKADAEERQKIKDEQDAAMKAARAAVADLKRAKPKTAASSPLRGPEDKTQPEPPPSEAPIPQTGDASSKAEGAGMALLNMLHKGRQDQSNAGYQQSQNLANELSGGRDANMWSEDGNQEEKWSKPDRSKEPAPRWSDEVWDSSLMNEYSTPLAAVSKEKRMEAARIAQEIEEANGYEVVRRDREPKGKGKRDHDDNYGSGGKGYNRYERRDGGKGKGDRDGKDDRKGKGKGKDRRDGKGDRDGKGYDRGGDRDGKGYDRGADRDGKGYDRGGERDGKGYNRGKDRDGKDREKGGKDREKGFSKGDRKGDREDNQGQGKGQNRERLPSDGADQNDEGSPQRRPREPPAQPAPTQMNSSRLNW